MGETAKKTAPGTVPIVLVVDWWDLEGVRRHAGETVKVPPSTATPLLEMGLALEDKG